MPADFDRCVKSGGRVRMMKPTKKKHMPVCFDKKGKSHAGEVKEKKSRA